MTHYKKISTFEVLICQVKYSDSLDKNKITVVPLDKARKTCIKNIMFLELRHLDTSTFFSTNLQLNSFLSKQKEF